MRLRVITDQSTGLRRRRVTPCACGLFVLTAIVLGGVASVVPALAQTRPVDPQAAREAADAAAVPVPESIEADASARPLAAGGNARRILSQNEAYNRARAAEGRVGVRLGNDMSFRVSE